MYSSSFFKQDEDKDSFWINLEIETSWKPTQEVSSPLEEVLLVKEEVCAVSPLVHAVELICRPLSPLQQCMDQCFGNVSSGEDNDDDTLILDTEKDKNSAFISTSLDTSPQAKSTIADEISAFAKAIRKKQPSPRSLRVEQ